MYTKSPPSFLADCSILSLITMRHKIAIRTEFIGLMSIIVLALGMMFMPVLSMAEQVEPAISCNEGSEPTALTYGDHTVGCAIDPATDLDRFEFCGTIGDEVRLNVFAVGSTNYMDPFVEIWDSSASIITQGSCTNSCTFSLEITLPASECYTIFVSDVGTNETGAYTMQLERIQPVPVSAANLIYDSLISDTINPATDVDYYTFNATAGTDIRLNVFAVGSTNYMDPTIEIRDPNGLVVVNGVADGATCENSCTYSVDLSPAVSGTYSLLIYDRNTNEAGPYELSLWCLFGPCDSDADGMLDGDPPVSINTPAVLAYGVPSIDTISPAVDGDMFIFGGTAGDLIRFSVLAAGSTNYMDPTIEVRDPNGLVVVNGVADGATCNDSCSFSMDLLPVISGTYSLLIYDRDTNETGSYEIGLQCLRGDCANAMPVCGDNCIDIANGPLILDPGGNVQRDTDGDGYGNMCDPDLNNDLIVQAADLALFKPLFFSTDPDADLDGNGRVQAGDLAILKKLFFLPPGPSCIAP